MAKTKKMSHTEEHLGQAMSEPELVPELDATTPVIKLQPGVKPGFMVITLKAGGDPVTIHQTQWPIFEKTGKWDVAVSDKKK